MSSNVSRFTGSKLEVYYLPNGATKGKDEIPLHTNQVALNIHRHVEEIDVTQWGDRNRHTIPGLERWEIDINTLGVYRDIPAFVRPGEKGLFTFLWGNRPDARHAEVYIGDFGIEFPNDGFMWHAKLLVSGPMFDGAYTCDHTYAIAQYDQGDGTFLEKPLIHQVPLDQLIDNRFHGWS